MADETKNYGFPKPGEGDFYDIGIFNLAMDRADEAIKEAEEKTGRHCMDKGIHITEEEREKWDSSLLSTGDSKDNTVTFNSGDAINPTGWADVGLVESGEEHKSLWRKVSLFAKNMRYLWKLYGAHDISKLGDGTLTGAISKLNTDLQYKDISNEITMLMEGISAKAYIENGMVIILSAIPKQYSGGTGELLQVPLKYAPRILVFGVMGYTWTRFDVGKVCHVMVSESGKVSFFQREPLNEIEQFTIQYPLKRG